MVNFIILISQRQAVPFELQSTITLISKTYRLAKKASYTLKKPLDRSRRPKVFLQKGILKICSKFTGEYPCGSKISINLQSSFIEITLRYGCSPGNLLHIFRTPVPIHTSGRLYLTRAPIQNFELGFAVAQKSSVKIL